MITFYFDSYCGALCNRFLSRVRSLFSQLITSHFVSFVIFQMLASDISPQMALQRRLTVKPYRQAKFCSQSVFYSSTGQYARFFSPFRTKSAYIWDYNGLPKYRLKTQFENHAGAFARTVHRK